VVDPGTGKGYQIKGTAEIINSGPLFDGAIEQMKAAPKGLPPVHHVVNITVEAVFDQSVGPDAGKQIA